MAPFPSLLNSYKSLNLLLPSKFFCLSFRTGFSLFLGPSTLFDFLLNFTQFLHFSLVLLGFNYLKDLIVWLLRLIILVSVVADQFCLGVE